MAEHTLFKNRKGRCNVITPAGVVMKFANGMYYTRDKELEAYLKHCADTNQCGVYIDPKEPTIDPEAASPQDRMKAKIIREWEEEKTRIARANTPATTQPGNSVQGPGSTGVVSSAGVATSAGATAKVAEAAGAAAAKAPSAPSSLEKLKSGQGKK